MVTALKQDLFTSGHFGGVTDLVRQYETLGEGRVENTVPTERHNAAPDGQDEKTGREEKGDGRPGRVSELTNREAERPSTPPTTGEGQTATTYYDPTHPTSSVKSRSYVPACPWCSYIDIPYPYPRVHRETTKHNQGTPQ